MLKPKGSLTASIVFIAFLLFGCNRHLNNLGEIRYSVLRLVSKIEKANEIHTEAIGYEGTKSKVYGSFLKLTRKATIRELLALTNHSSPVVRGYSFWALAKRKYDRLDKVINNHANDDEPIYFLQGCIGGNFPLIDIMYLMVSPDNIDLECKKLTQSEFDILEKYRMLVKLLHEDNGTISWPDQILEKGQRKIIEMEFAFDGPCAIRPCENNVKNKLMLDYVRKVMVNYHEVEIGIGVFSGSGGDFAYNKTITQAKADGIKKTMALLNFDEERIITLGFGNKKMNPNYRSIKEIGSENYWIEFVIMKKGRMTLVEFNQRLSKIDFSNGVNVEKLEDYLLACLAQLEIYKAAEPTYDLFLRILDQSRNGPKAEFDSSWKDLYIVDKGWLDSNWDSLTEWERVTHELRSLVTDLINTREIRTQPDYVQKEMQFEWDTEGGTRFYNGTTPSSILGYASTRFEGEYPPAAFQIQDLSWGDLTNSIWIGISYE